MCPRHVLRAAGAPEQWKRVSAIIWPITHFHNKIVFSFYHKIKIWLHPYALNTCSLKKCLVQPLISFTEPTQIFAQDEHRIFFCIALQDHDPQVWSYYAKCRAHVVFNKYVPELGEVVEKRKEVTHNNESGSRPYFDQVTHFHNKFVFGFQLCKRITPVC